MNYSGDATNGVGSVITAISGLLLGRGLICLDLVDMDPLLRNGGLAVMGQGEASGEGRARIAAERAVADLRWQLASLRMQNVEKEELNENE